MTIYNLIFSLIICTCTSQLCSAKNYNSYPPLNTNIIKEKSIPHISIPQNNSFNELINLTDSNRLYESLLTRRKGEVKYSDLKVSWKDFIKNLSKKRQNPDQVILDKKKSLS